MQNQVTAFIVENNIFKVVATNHGKDQMNTRNINEYHIAGACLSLGEKLTEYNNNGMQVMIVDKGRNLTCIVAVENYTIVVVTVIDTGEPYVIATKRHKTVIENYALGSAS